MNKRVDEGNEITEVQYIPEEELTEQFRRGLAMIRQGAMPVHSNEMRELRKYADGHAYETGLLYAALFDACEAHEKHVAKLLSQIERMKKDWNQLLRANVRLSQIAQAKKAG